MTNKLDDHLKAWAKQHAEETMNVSKIKHAVHEEARRGKSSSSPSSAELLLLKWRYAAIGACLAFVCSYGAFHMSSSSKTPSEGMFTRHPAGMPAGNADSDAVVFQELYRLFGDRLRWAAETESGMQFGIDSDSPAEVTTSPLFVEIAVVSRTMDSDEEWSVVWNADVMIQQQHYVEISEGSKWFSMLDLWAYELEDGRIAIDSDIHLRDPLVVNGHAQNVLVPGESMRVLTLNDGKSEYSIIQTVRRLDAS